ncbi:hypothetical protein PR048_009829 [Dryococelus australis]|uniref:Uncharacterized protein n=1 Tax=Dryococelus australis TaxID=614101 RepID=A0ABQ9I106_9NEOP|nr:hypothetical protein PR048_009829 [Dryococelus australis]
MGRGLPPTPVTGGQVRRQLGWSPGASRRIDSSITEPARCQKDGPWWHRTNHLNCMTGLLASHQGEPGSIPGQVIPDFRKWELCQTIPHVYGFPRGSPVSPALSFQRCSILTSFTLIGSQDLDILLPMDKFPLQHAKRLQIRISWHAATFKYYYCVYSVCMRLAYKKVLHLLVRLLNKRGCCEKTLTMAAEDSVELGPLAWWPSFQVSLGRLKQGGREQPLIYAYILVGPISLLFPPPPGRCCHNIWAGPSRSRCPTRLHTFCQPKLLVTTAQSYLLTALTTSRMLFWSHDLQNILYEDNGRPSHECFSVECALPKGGVCCPLIFFAFFGNCLWASLLHWLLHRCEATPFLTALPVIGEHNCEEFIYWRSVTHGVSEKAWSKVGDTTVSVVASGIAAVALEHKTVSRLQHAGDANKLLGAFSRLAASGRPLLSITKDARVYLALNCHCNRDSSFSLSHPVLRRPSSDGIEKVTWRSFGDILCSTAGRSGVAVRLLTSRQGDLVSITGAATPSPRLSRVGIMPDHARRSTGFSRGPPVSPALVFRRCSVRTLVSPSSALKTSLFRWSLYREQPLKAFAPAHDSTRRRGASPRRRQGDAPTAAEGHSPHVVVPPVRQGHAGHERPSPRLTPARACPPPPPSHIIPTRTCPRLAGAERLHQGHWYSTFTVTSHFALAMAAQSLSAAVHLPLHAFLVGVRGSP